MATADMWICKACWQKNRARDEVCWRCKAPPGVPDDEAQKHRDALEARKQRAAAVPDAVVAVPVVVFRGYAKAWQRGGLSLFGLLIFFALGGVTDLLWFGLTIGFGLGLFICGLVAGEVAEGMREREAWAYLVGIVLSVAGGIGSVMAFDIFAPELINSAAIRWVSIFVFGGAAVAAIAGLVLLMRNKLPAT
jgi:hypothetical protein